MSLPVSDGADEIWVIVDRHTKMVHFVPLKIESKTAAALARIFAKEVWRIHGLPDDIISEGSMSASMVSMCTLQRCLPGLKLTKMQAVLNRVETQVTNDLKWCLEQLIARDMDMSSVGGAVLQRLAVELADVWARP